MKWKDPRSKGYSFDLSKLQSRFRHETTRFYNENLIVTKVMIILYSILLHVYQRVLE